MEGQEIRGTKNLGFIQAIHSGVNAPLNIRMIWYDDNIGEKIHKYYDVSLSTWVSLGTNPPPQIEGNIKLRIRVVTLSVLNLASFDLVTRTIVANYFQSLSINVGSDELLTLEVTNGVPNKKQIWQSTRGKGSSSLITDADVLLISDNTSLSSDANFVHNQILSSTSWTVNHGLNKYPSVILIDNDGYEFDAIIRHVDTNNVIITVSPATSGKAIFN